MDVFSGNLDMMLVYLIIFFAVAAMFTVLLLFFYSGFFYTISVGAGSPPFKNVTIAYKFGRGQYSDTGKVFTESVAFAPSKRSIGIYYDDPSQVEPEDLRWAVGVILTEGDCPMPDEQTRREKERLLKNDYKIFGLPQMSSAVITKFPYRSFLSILMGVYRVYPEISKYISERKLCAYPTIEVCDNEWLHYVVPLCKQDDFFVPESLEMPAEESKTVENDEDNSITKAKADSTVAEDSSGERSMPPVQDMHVQEANVSSTNVTSNDMSHQTIDTSSDMSHMTSDQSERSANTSGSGTCSSDASLDSDGNDTTSSLEEWQLSKEEMQYLKEETAKQKKQNQNDEKEQCNARNNDEQGPKLD